MLPLRRPIVCLVTGGTARPGAPGGADAETLELASRSAAAGVNLLQVRERRLTDADCLALTQAIVSAVDGTGAAVVVNERSDIAQLAGASGVHLRSDSPSALRVRAAVPAGFLVGRSVHSADEARSVERDGAVDYLIFGTVFPSATKGAAHQASGLRALGEVCRAVQLPVLAIGGMTADTLPAAAAAGASGFAGISVFRNALAADRLDDLMHAATRAFAGQ